MNIFARFKFTQMKNSLLNFHSETSTILFWIPLFHIFLYNTMNLLLIKIQMRMRVWMHVDKNQADYTYSLLKQGWLLICLIVFVYTLFFL